MFVEIFTYESNRRETHAIIINTDRIIVLEELNTIDKTNKTIITKYLHVLHMDSGLTYTISSASAEKIKTKVMATH